MSSYRFCRTDDVALLVDALNHCWSPYFPDEPPMTPAAFKRSIRDLQVWCSSLSAPPGSSPKSPRRSPPACELFSASGYVQEALLTDYVLQREENDAREVAGMSDPPSPRLRRGLAEALRAEADDHDGRFVIPVTVDDLAANGLLGEAHPQVWKRSVETLTARKDDIAGLAVASDERIEAYLLYVKPGAEGTEIVSLRSFIEDGGDRLTQLLSRLGMGTFRFAKVHPAEISQECLETLGFRPAGGHLLYAATLRPFDKLRVAPSNVEGRETIATINGVFARARLPLGRPDDCLNNKKARPLARAGLQENRKIDLELPAH
jgi:hypothetical protein